MGKGKGKDSHAGDQEHRSRPLASLKDPDAFGPPPKNLNYHGGAAVSDNITPEIKEEEVQREIDIVKESASQKGVAPPIPYRADTTGLSTRNLPEPPLRRNKDETQQRESPPNPGNKPKPSLPPRLPPRQGSKASEGPFSPPPPESATASATPNVARENVESQGALRRLGSAGIHVPGLSIGGTDPNNRRDHATHGGSESKSGPLAGKGSQINELQSKFSRISVKPQSPGSPSQGTSFAEKQAAFKTASSFRNDPSSVSLADARATASTANNFRERHGDQVASGWKSANALNKKYDLSSKVGGYAPDSGASNKNEPNPPAATPDAPNALVSMIKKKAPPPPPKKLFTGDDSAGSPPPIPLSSKPKQ